MILAVFLLLLIFALLSGVLFASGILVMKILYTFCIGLPIAICLGVIGVLLCITVIGVPVGLLLFRMAGVVLVPFR